MQRDNGEHNEETPRPSSTGFEVKSFRPGRGDRTNTNEDEVLRLLQEGGELEGSQIGKRIENLSAAIDKYQQALALVSPDSHFVREANGMIVRASDELKRLRAAQEVMPLPPVQSLPSRASTSSPGFEPKRRRRRGEFAIDEIAQQLLQQAEQLHHTSNGNRRNNLENAVQIYQNALGRVELDSEIATQIKQEMSQAIDDLAQLMDVTLNAPNLAAPAFQTLAPTVKDIRDMLTGIQYVTQHNGRAAQSLRTKEDEVGPILELKDTISHTIDSTTNWLAHPALLEWMIGIALVMLIVLLVSIIALPWYYNFSSWQRCPGGSTAPGTTISTSPTLTPLLNAAVQQYKQTCSVTITVVANNQASSPDGINAVDSAQATIGAADVMAYASHNALYDDRIAVMPFVFVVDKNAGVSDLTTQNIRDIYSGGISNWQDVCHLDQQKQRVCGNNLPINVVERPANSDARAVFEQYVLGGSDYLLGAVVSDTDSSIVQDIKSPNLPGAIGYVSLYAARQAGLTPMPVDGVMPALATINNGSYTFWAIEHLYTQGRATGVAQKFIYFMHTDDGMKLLQQYGFLTINEISSTALSDHLGQV